MRRWLCCRSAQAALSALSLCGCEQRRAEGVRAPCVGGRLAGGAQLSRDAALTDALLHSIVPGRTHASPPCQRRARRGALLPKP